MKFFDFLFFFVLWLFIANLLFCDKFAYFITENIFLHHFYVLDKRFESNNWLAKFYRDIAAIMDEVKEKVAGNKENSTIWIIVMCAEKLLEILKRAKNVKSQNVLIISWVTIFAKLTSTTLLNQNLHHTKSRLLLYQAILNPLMTIIMYATQESMFFAKFVTTQCAKIIVVSMVKLSVKNVLYVKAVVSIIFCCKILGICFLW